MPKRPFQSPYRAIPDILGQSEHFHSWLSRHRAEMELNRYVRQCLPSLLAGETRVRGFYDEKLKLGVPTGTFAAILKQYEPIIKETLAAHGYECKSISIRVQPRKTREISIKIENSLPPLPRAPLEKLANSLSEGRLKEAIKSLLKYSF